MSMVTTSNDFPDTQYINLLVGNRKYVRRRSEPLKGVKRALKLFILCFILPLILLIYPLYLRNRVYTTQEYPMGISDMLTIDNSISTTWCQRQLIKANTTYNAYVIADEPKISQKNEKIDMTRKMLLKDGAKEYWGFYLLKGSSFTISTCVRWPGASLIVIEGHRNLKECAYVGDNSSEENDKSDRSSDENRNVSIPSQMTKISPGVVLNYSWKSGNLSELNVTESFLNESYAKLSKAGEKKLNNKHLQYAENLYLKERKKNTNQSSTQAFETTTRPSLKDSAEVLKDVMTKLETLGPEGNQILMKLNISNHRHVDVTTDRGPLEDILYALAKLIKDVYGENWSSPKNNKKSKINETRMVDEKEEFQKLHNEIMLHRSRISLLDREPNTGQEVFYETDKADMHVTVKNSKPDDRSKSEFWSSVSSSEERLLECRGLLVSLPLIPHYGCNMSYDDKALGNLATANRISYQIQRNGYYFFIFNNENEVENNFIHAHFNITKTLYDTSEAIAVCRNQTKECSLPLSFWSRERTILEKEKPYPMNDDSWNEEFMVVTQCEPRSIIYVICSMCVLMGILLFAFT